MIKISPTQAQNFLDCQTRQLYSGEEYIKPVQTPDALRTGTNWHDLHEIIGSSTDQDYDTLMELITESLNLAYNDVPDWADKLDWEIERNVLHYAIAAYLAVPGRNYGTRVLDTDVSFRIPLHNPRTGEMIEDGILTGKLDEIGILPDGTVCVPDYKSTKSAVDDASSLWDELEQSLQGKIYVYALQHLQRDGKLLKYGIKPSDPLIRTAFFSAWKKPGISPKFLSQKDTAEFFVSQDYLGTRFEFNHAPGTSATAIDGVLPEVKLGKKEGTFAIKETPQMYGCRLYQEMIENPDTYFNCRSFSYTDKDMEYLEQELFDLYRSMKFARENKVYTKNRKMCRPRAGFKCDYCEICDNHMDITKELPEGLQRS